MKKYSNGKVKRTLKKGLKVLEMVKSEWNKIISIENNNIHFIQFKNFKKFLKIIEMTYCHYGI